MGPRATLTLSLCLGSSLALAAPEDMGSARVETWDAGPVTLAGTPIRVVAYLPAGMSRRPVVAVVHGASRNGGYQRTLGQTLASQGLVAVVPDIPCNVWACDHDANANQINALLDWAVAQSAIASSRLAGAVDGTRRGLIGHSWGALGSAMAASRNTGVASLVLFDPNDDAFVGARSASRIRTPTLTLLAQTRGVCNNQWIATSITPALGGPGVHATLARSGHCDPEDPTDALCPLLCGRGDVATTPLFRRYAIAWTRCNLTGDVAMAPWVMGAAWDADQRAGRLTGVVRAGAVADLACLRGAVDAGALTDAALTDAALTDAALTDIALTDAALTDAALTDTAVPVDVPAEPDLDASGIIDVTAADVVTVDVAPPRDEGTLRDAPVFTVDADARTDRTASGQGAGCGCAAAGGGTHRAFGLLAVFGLRRRRGARGRRVPSRRR